MLPNVLRNMFPLQAMGFSPCVLAGVGEVPAYGCDVDANADDWGGSGSREIRGCSWFSREPSNGSPHSWSATPQSVVGSAGAVVGGIVVSVGGARENDDGKDMFVPDPTPLSASFMTKSVS
jgi:hypothetical protein